MDESTPDLSVNIGGIQLRNPVMTASGTFGYGEEYEPFLDLHKLGAIITKGISLLPMSGNLPPRIVETTGGMLNAIGLENIGVDLFIKEKLPYLRRTGSRIIANILGNTVEAYGNVATILDRVQGLSGLEVNISCPNIKEGGDAFGRDPRSAARVVDAVKQSTKLPVIVKLSPNVTDIGEIAKSVQSAGADAVSLINTVTGMAVDIEKKAPKLANITGGLSGPAIKPIALRMVWEVSQAVSIPVIGIGGIMTANDAIEFFIAGASAIQVGTANFVNPEATLDILSGIEKYLKDHSLNSILSLVGTLRV